MMDGEGVLVQPQRGTPAEDPSLHELKPNAIGLLQSTIIGIATSAPGQATAVSLAAIIAVSAYAGGVAVLVCTLPMLAIALSYQRLNLWEQNCGGSYVWVGRSINPYVGYLVGWAMLVGYVLGDVSNILPLGPAVLSLFGVSNTSGTLGNVLTVTIFGILVTLFAVLGIQFTARFQMSIAFVEYAILILFCGVGIYGVFFAHWAGTVHPSAAWFTLKGVGGKGSLAAGMLIAIYLFTGWDASIYINEETERKEVNPGRAVIIAVAVLGPFYTLLVIALQGAASASQMNAHADTALPFAAQALLGTGWAKMMAIAVILSVIGTAQAALVAAVRISYAMGTDRLLPRILGTVNPRFQTPAFATLLWGGVVIVVGDIYVSSGSLAGAFDSVVSSVGLLFTLFYLSTGVATTWYYRKLLTRSAADLLMIGVFPLAGAAVLVWIFLKAIVTFHGVDLWSLVGIAVVGVLLMLVSAFVTKSPFFAIRRVAYDPAADSEQQA